MAYTSKVRICDTFTIPENWDASKGVPSGNVVILTLEKGDKYPATIEEVEALVEKGRVESKDLTKARTIIATHKTIAADAKAAEESK